MSLERARRLELLERGFVVLAMLLLTGVRMQSQEGDVTTANPVAQALFAGIYLVVGFLLAFRWKQVEGVIARDGLLWLLLSFALCSAAWSAAPEVTARRLAALTGTTFFGVYLASRFSLGEQLSLAAWAMIAAMLLSVACVIALPHYGLEYDVGGGLCCRGIYSTKNALGRLMVLGVVVMILVLGRDWKRSTPWVGLVLVLGLLLLSRSKTSLVVLLALLALLAFYRTLWEHRYLATGAILLASVPFVFAAAWMLSHPETVVGWLGKDSTLTGRTTLWSAVIEMIGRRPWLGYGFGGFWQGWKGESAYICWMTNWDWAPPHAHNGFLDLWLDLGLVGVVLFALDYLVAFSGAIGRLRTAKMAESLWPVMYLSFLILFNLTENTLMRINSLFWALYVSSVLSRPATPGCQVASSAQAETRDAETRVDLPGSFVGETA